ncbi:MAG: hypothetical protein ACTSQA_01195 [Candidatus Heimdallarchaeaceae archaeon]
MDKSKLQNRHVVLLANGHKGLIIDNFIIYKDGNLDLDYYNIRLARKYRHEKVLDIIAVFPKITTLREIKEYKISDAIWRKDSAENLIKELGF